MAVRLLHGGADRRADMREEQVRTDMTSELAQVLVIPGRLDAPEDTRDRVVASYQPTPNPSPLVVLGAEPECRLWSISEWTGVYSTRVSSTGDPV
jgi:hypothetical protein